MQQVSWKEEDSMYRHILLQNIYFSSKKCHTVPVPAWKVTHIYIKRASLKYCRCILINGCCFVCFDAKYCKPSVFEGTKMLSCFSYNYFSMCYSALLHVMCLK